MKVKLVKIKTPRVDAFKEEIRHMNPKAQWGNWVYFSRILERELSEARDALQSLRGRQKIKEVA